ncbi:MAG TPA: hypothetical protein VHL52_13675 [Acidimicrobiia bacterium]|nr:hypothetical protein [Acidimicrobiia bacterium]
MDDLRSIVGEKVTVEVVEVGPPAQDHFEPGMFKLLESILGELDPSGIPILYLFNESPDGRLFADHGIHHFGFLPMDLPPEIDLPGLIHGPDERVPVSSIDFGAEALFRLIGRY